MEKLVSLAKRRGFIYQGSEIYGGLAGTYDYGPLGTALKNNIKNIWWRMFVDGRDDMYGMDASILMNPRVWETTGHVAGFADPLSECTKCKKRFRTDQIEDRTKCPECGGALGPERQFNMMLKTQVGAMEDSSSISYLRPETAQGMFVNFKNVVDSFHPKMPFGLGQTGKAFRNEITPRDFIFRLRELEQMEVEYFVKESDWQRAFEEWRVAMNTWIDTVGIDRARTHEVEIGDGDRAHYSKRTIDFEFEYPFGQKELYGLAYRTDFDLSRHSEASKVDLSYRDEEVGEKFIPHCIEPSFGLDRTMLAVLLSAYTEDTMGDSPREYLKFHPRVAPIKVAVSPLLKNKPELVEKAREVYDMLKKDIPQIMWDDNGNVGKRYRRQDEIGTPFCVTIDFDTLGETPEHKDTVTVRDRDTGNQKRLSIGDLKNYILEQIK
ncbi:MAG TPA: glycine--tRNA ligase [Candidatus Yonathbacteria bacterium]|nr:glycine--tRNA ligase [Candidatus Yonathbacteria bacterium]